MQDRKTDSVGQDQESKGCQKFKTTNANGLSGLSTNLNQHSGNAQSAGLWFGVDVLSADDAKIAAHLFAIQREQGESISVFEDSEDPVGAGIVACVEPGGDSRPARLLETKGNVVDSVENAGEIIEQRYDLTPCSCKSRFCENCCVPLGVKLRARLQEKVKGWPSVMMYTLTIDPELFESPQEAYRYLRKRRPISELIRALKKKGYLESGEYFYVVEWQEETEMVHFHMIVPANYIPHAFVMDVWGRNRPKGLPPAEDGRPGFGFVFFSKIKDLSPAHAANYVTKYLTKHPKNGYPDWVLDFKSDNGEFGNVPKYGTSRGFWGTTSEPKPAPDDAFEAFPTDDKLCERGHSDMCFCSTCRGDFEDDEDDGKQSRRSIRERLEDCKQNAQIVHIVKYRTDDGGEVEERSFVCPCPMSFEIMKIWCGINDSLVAGIEIPESTAQRLWLEWMSYTAKEKGWCGFNTRFKGHQLELWDKREEFF